MERKSFVFYKDWKDAISDLPDDIRLEIYESIIEYAVSGAFQGLKPMAKIAFNFIKTDLDRDIEKYQKVINRNKENIGKRWSKENTKNTSGISGKTENTKNTDNDNDNDNVSKETKSSDDDLGKKDKNTPSPSPDDPITDQSQDTESQAPPPTPSPERSTPQPPSELSRFTPPTVEEVREYCIERNNGVDPAMFVDFYISKGWKIGKNKMKDWRAAVRTWEAKQREDNASKTGNLSCIQNNGVQKGRYEKLIESGKEALKILGINDNND